jgi:hypothetical protein
MNRNTVITQLRTLLNDAALAIWTAALLDVHIDAAMEYLSRQWPSDDYKDIATVAASRDISLATLTRPVRVYAAEWPIGNSPRDYQHFGIFGDVLTFDSPAPGDGTSMRVYYGRYRELWSQWKYSTMYSLGDKVVPAVANGYCYECIDAGYSSVVDEEPTWPTTIGETVEDDEVIWQCRAYPSIPVDTYSLLCLGASGYALEEYGRRILNSFNSGGPKAASEYMKRGYQSLTEFRKEVRILSGANRIRVNKLYVPNDYRVSRFTDPGPGF